jgi:hypothetical protein
MRGIRPALILSASLTLLPALSAAADDPYADYRIPEHYWRSWTANVTAIGDFQRGTGPFSGESKNSRVSARGSTSFTGGFDSDPRSTVYELSFSALADRARAEQQFVLVPTDVTIDGTSQFTRTNQVLSGFIGDSRYPWGIPLGISFSAAVDAAFDQTWNSGSQIARSPTTEAQTTSSFTTGGYNVNSQLTAGLDWGRVRDATPVYQVQVLEQRLLQEGTIQRELSRTARERLASLYTTEARLAFAHDRPTKYFWRELERLLTDDGVLSERGLDAYAVQRLLEPLTIRGSVLLRFRGLSVGPQVVLFQQQQHVSTGGTSSDAFYVNGTLVNASEMVIPRTETNDRDDFILSGVTVQYHEPFGPRWQVDGVSRALVTEGGEDFLLSTGLQAVWLVADRWYADAKFLHNLRAPGSGWDRKPETWTVVSGASLSYFLEDDWALTLSAQQQQLHDTIFYQRREVFALGVSYRFSGFLNAPGLFEPMRLSPPTR